MTEPRATMDDAVSLYEGKIVSDRLIIQKTGDPGVRRHYEAKLKRDQLILGALKCAKLHGYTGETE